jgi:hypothetical protein
MCANVEMAFSFDNRKNDCAAAIAATPQLTDLERPARDWTRAVLARSGIPAPQKVFGGALLAAFLAAGLPCAAQAAAISFDFKPQTILGVRMSGADNIDKIYETANGWGVTFLDPIVPVNPLDYSTPAGTGTLYYNFFNTLNRMYPTTSGWSVTGNAAPLAAGSLQITTYGAIGTPAVVGADFALSYLTTMPGPNNTVAPNGNPTTNLHWIQVVSDNNALTFPGGRRASNPGTPANKVDVTRANTTSPYYDQGGGAANSRSFRDRPRRPDVEFDNTWIAALFLVSGPSNPGTSATPATITVYNDSGITWGWDNFFFTDVNEQQFIADVENDVFGGDQLGPALTTDYALYQQAFLASVPEPSAWAMMLLGFAGLGVAGYRTSRKAISIVA